MFDKKDWTAKYTKAITINCKTTIKIETLAQNKLLHQTFDEFD